MDLRLYHSPFACSLACRFALAEANLPHELVMVRTSRQENRSEEFKRINPTQKIPVLEANGTIITETSAILPFIAELSPSSQLLPTDPIKKAQVLSLVGYLSSTVHPAWTAIMHPERFTAEPNSIKDVRNSAITRIGASLQLLETTFSSTPLGETFDISQAYLAVLLAWRAHPLVKGLPLTPALDMLQERVLARPRLQPLVQADLAAYAEDMTDKTE
ncbi:glutathione S-transferase family protein [Pseudomonas gingeri]|uniref:Glutathione S-transferase family protein n=1 Tax=Pseudomonas gingeri TaxID=117681 RepID=A0A7Y8C3A8_9PSED|nr:glutathione S-transferase family protein [Pseudomonas gingeri]NWB97021.1 glutathione S-transferase family protein [Pseudomonas gingeri]